MTIESQVAAILKFITEEQVRPLAGELPGVVVGSADRGFVVCGSDLGGFGRVAAGDAGGARRTERLTENRYFAFYMALTFNAKTRRELLRVSAIHSGLWNCIGVSFRWQRLDLGDYSGMSSPVEELSV
jgi:hypothetical protein